MSAANHRSDEPRSPSILTPSSTDSSLPTRSPIPLLPPHSDITPEEGGKTGEHVETSESVQRPSPKVPFPTPKLRIHCEDLRHPGARAFFGSVDPSKHLDDAVNAVLEILYGHHGPPDLVPPTRSVTLVLKSVGGVAQTGGTDLDNDHKEILFSLDYIAQKAQSDQSDQVGREIEGVLVHEMVHAWQWNGQGKAPGGLIEGIADFVRLRAELDPPHWKREKPEKWDAGYQHTAFFLEWIEEKWGTGSVRKINAALKDEYRESVFWKALFKQDVGDLFEQYQHSFHDS